MPSAIVGLGAWIGVLALAVPASAQDEVAHEWGPSRLTLADPPPPGKKPQEVESLPQEEKLPDELRSWRKREGSPFLDLGWVDLETRAGVAMFTDAYKIGPSPAVSFLFRAPMPWLSPSSDPDGDYFGAYIDLAVLPGVKRDLNPPPPKDSGSVLLLTLGADFTLVRNQGFLLMVRGGGQYASYGGIDGLADGWGGTAGLVTGFYIGSGMTFTLSGDAVFVKSGDMIGLGYLGLLIEF